MHVEVQEIRLSKVSSLASEETVEEVQGRGGVPPSQLLKLEIDAKQLGEAMSICEVMKKDIASMAL